MSNAAKIIIVLLVAMMIVGTVASVLMVGILSTRKPEASPAAPPPTAQEAPAEDTLARIRARGTLRLGIDTGTPAWAGNPPSYLTLESGQPDGLDVRLANRIAAAVGVARVEPIHKKYVDFEQALTRETDVDLVIGGFTPYEAPGIAWSAPYLEYGLCLVVPARSPIQTTADLVGKTIGIWPDDAAEAEVKKQVKGYKKLVRLDAGYWDQLTSGTLDAYLYDHPFTVAEVKTWYAQNPHKVGSLRIAQYNLTDSTYAVAVRATDQALLRIVNETVAAWRKSDDYKVALRSFLGSEDLPEPVQEAGGYDVKRGDTLGSIAQAELGSSARWTEIWALNKSRYPNPDLVEVGDRLTLPPR